jgi:uncharacterized protein YkwD
MTAISILPIASDVGNSGYRAILGDQQSIGTTIGEAFDALIAKLGPTGFSSAILLTQSVQPDSYFTASQQQRLTELMAQWRSARDRSDQLAPELQMELDALVEAELTASTQRLMATTQIITA